MHELLPDGRYGADDEDPRSDLASFGEEDYLVASSRDHRDHRPTDGRMALAVQGVMTAYRTGKPMQLPWTGSAKNWYILSPGWAP